MKIDAVRLLGIVAIGLAGAICAAGCNQNTGSDVGPGEKAGAAVDKAAEKTVEAVKDTAEKAKDATGKAVEKSGEAMEKAGKDMQK